MRRGLGLAGENETGKLGLEQRVQRLEDESIIRWKLQDYMRLLQSPDWDEWRIGYRTVKWDLLRGQSAGASGSTVEAETLRVSGKGV